MCAIGGNLFICMACPSAFFLLSAYGCGPNIIIGVPGALIASSLVVKEKMQIAWLKGQIQQNSDSNNIDELNKKIKILTVNEQYHQSIAKIFARSLVPIIGPWWALGLF